MTQIKLNPHSRWCAAASFFFVLTAVQVAAAAPPKVRLFILSGQSNMAGLNPDISFTPAVKEAYSGDDVIVVKHAVGGQSIRRWYKDWKTPEGVVDRAPSPDAKPGDLYDALMAKVKAATAGKTVDSIAFVWMQGEADTSQGRETLHDEALRGLIRQVRDDLKRPDTVIVIGRLSDCRKGQAGWDLVRSIQEKVAGTDRLAAWVDTDDLNGDKDDLHYTKEGYAELGRRFAAKAVELLNQGPKGGQ
jgi:hypothetical protein